MNELQILFEQASDATKCADFPAAIRAYQQIIGKSGVNSKAHHLAYWGIGEIHLNNGKYGEAKKYLKKALELSPDEPIYHYLLGCTYRYTDEIDASIRHLEKAVAIDPSVEQYWCELGYVVGYNRDGDKGIEYLKKSLSINPANAAALRDICMLYAKQHKWGEALVCIEEAAGHAPDDPLINSCGLMLNISGRSSSDCRGSNILQKAFEFPAEELQFIVSGC